MKNKNNSQFIPTSDKEGSSFFMFINNSALKFDNSVNIEKIQFTNKLFV